MSTGSLPVEHFHFLESDQSLGQHVSQNPRKIANFLFALDLRNRMVNDLYYAPTGLGFLGVP